MTEPVSDPVAFVRFRPGLTMKLDSIHWVQMPVAYDFVEMSHDIMITGAFICPVRLTFWKRLSAAWSLLRFGGPKWSPMRCAKKRGVRWTLA